MKFPSLVLIPLFLGVDSVSSNPLSEEDRVHSPPQFKQIGEEIDRDLRRLDQKQSRHYGHAIVKVIPEGKEVSFKVSSQDSNMRLALASDEEDLEYSLSSPEDKTNSLFESLDRMSSDTHVKSHESMGATASVATEGIMFKMEDDVAGLLQVKATPVNGNTRGLKKRTRQGGKKEKTKKSLSSGGTVAILNHGSNTEACFEAMELVHYVGEAATFQIGLCDSDADTVFANAIQSATFSYMTEKGDRGEAQALVSVNDSSGWIEVSFVPNMTGSYKITFNIDAVTEDGDEVERQVTTSIPVIAKQLESVQAVSMNMIGEEIKLSVALSLADGYVPTASDTFILSADLLDGTGADVMTSSAMSTLVDGNTLVVTIQPEWFAGRSGEYTVEYLTVKDAGGAIPLIIAEDVPIDSTSLPSVFPEARRRLSESDTDRKRRLTQGVAPVALNEEGNSRRSLQSASSNIIATHGYCADDNPWKTESAFEGANFFEDLSQSRTHDEFALRLRDYGNSLGFSATPGNGCSIVAHSQGGAAALHLYTYYFSCLDGSADNGNRLIQSVGTPYQGTSLAGNVASLGDVFGVGCGDNDDLTYDGAASWLSGIPNWARAKVNYYTTSFSTKWWRNDYCNIASDLILSDPEDGTTEKAYGQLPGGINRGHKTGWCHIAGMRDPAQTSDNSRNKEMVANSA